MKRKLLGLMTLFLTVGALSSFAANDNNKKDNKEQCKKEQCDKSKCDKGDKAKCDKTKCDRKGYNPFEGITITADQQAKLDALKANRPDRNNNEGKTGKEARPDRRQIKRDYLAKVKEILTPEQYVVFLENSVVNAPAMRPDKAMRHGKGNRPDKGQRPDRGSRPDKAPRDHAQR